jgi:hypothetical protein
MNDNSNDFKQHPVGGENPPQEQTPEMTLDEETRARIESHLPSQGFYAANKWFIWASVVALLIIGVLGYLVFFTGGAGSGSEANVNVSIDVPETVPTGSEVVFKVRVENQDSVSLSAGQLEVVFPEGASYVASTPQAKNTSGTLYPVPELSPGQNTVIFVKLKLSGNIADTEKMTTRYTYSVKGINSQFSKVASVEVQLVASDVVVEWDGPTTTNNAQLIIYTLRYRNGSSKDIPGSRVQVTYPDGFTPATRNPEATLGGNTWDIGVLRAGQEGTITIQGSFTNAQGGSSKTVKADFLVLGNDGNYFTQGSSEYATTISNSPLFLSLESENTGDLGIAKPGQRINMVLKYANNAKVAARAVNIRATIDSKAVDAASFNTNGGIVNGNTITWNASTTPKLETLAPNSNGEIRFSFSIKNPPVKDNSKNITVKITNNITSGEYSSPFPGNEITLKIGTVASLTRSAVYVSGSLPPKVGKSTVYEVTLTVRNTTNDVSDGVITAFMPLTPASFDKNSVTPKESANVSFDPNTGKITWKIGSVPSGSGSFVTAKTLSFKITLTPTSSMQNKPVQLLKTITFGGKDIFTSQDINLTTEDLSTFDVNNGSDGTVSP